MATATPPPPDEPFEVIDLDQLPSFTDEPYVEQIGEDIPRRQERTRGLLALSLTIIFALVLFAPLFDFDHWRVPEDWLNSALPAVTGLLGSALGFYFGQRNR